MAAHLPLAAPSRIDPRLLAPPLTAIGALLLVSLEPGPFPLPGYLPLSSVILALALAGAYAGAVAWAKRPVVTILVLAGLTLLFAGADGMRGDPSARILAFSPLLGIPFALLLAGPALLARRARQTPAGDALDRAAALVALWLGTLAAGTVAWAGTWHEQGLFNSRVLIGDGRLPWKVALPALALGVGLAAAVLLRDVIRLRFLAALRDNPTCEIVPWKDAEDPEAPAIPYLAGAAVDGALVVKIREGGSAFRERGVDTVVTWLPLDLGAARRALLRRAALCAALVLGESLGVAALARALLVHGQPLTGIVAVAPASDHTCALRGDGDVLCWGLNDEGQLGDGTLAQSYGPVAVRGLHGVAELRTGCALLRSGEVRCWGDREPRWREAHPVAGLPSARLLATTEGYACVVTRADEVLCWSRHAAPVRILEAPKVLDLAIDGWGGCVRLPDRLQCWRHPVDSLAATRTFSPPCFPAPQSGPPREATLRLEGDRAFEVTSEGAVVYWKQIPSSTLDQKRCEAPVELEGVKDVVSFTFWHTLGEDGVVREVRWQDDSWRSIPVLTHVVDLRGQAPNACAVRVDGTVWCRGANEFGQLGDGTRAYQDEMVQVRR